ncbi:hypothetical protein [Lactococcus garvieae]|uniref:YozE SAM-like domain-containing protein n=1 Tax=Lactococcus garvieae TaxID=1363 RepID=A0AAX3NGW5_9LACT|nr:hypothetical protein [Lactococcus garvieae]WEA14844.1 hypothetical protein PWF74_04875 [Lactococcus garvieae]
MTFLQYVKQQLEMKNHYKLHVTAGDRYPEFIEWFSNDNNNWENCKAFLAMVDGYIEE